MCDYPTLSIRRITQLAKAKVDQYLIDYSYKVYIATMLKMLVQPHYEEKLVSWVDMVKSMHDAHDTQEKSVNDMVNDVISRTGVEVIDEEVTLNGCV